MIRMVRLLLTQRLLAAVAQPVPLVGHELKVSASIGLSLFPQPDDVDADQLLRQADLAMYQAKLAGKNRYHVFDTAHDRSLRGRYEDLARIRPDGAGQCLDQRGFPRAVVADDGKDFAGVKVEIDAIEGQDPRKTLGNTR